MIFQPSRSVDLSRGRPPEEFHVCLIDDSTKVREWRESPACFDYTRPSSSWCMLTCLRMLLLLRDRKAPSLDRLFHEASGAQVYRWEQDVGGHGPGWKGADHAKFAAYVERYGFDARIQKDVGTDDLARALDDGEFVIPSVSPDIRFPERETEPAKRGGHTVLLYAYDVEGDSRSFRIQNSAGFERQTQVGVPVSEGRMRQVLGAHATFLRQRA